MTDDDVQTIKLSGDALTRIYDPSLTRVLDQVGVMVAHLWPGRRLEVEIFLDPPLFGAVILERDAS